MVPSYGHQSRKEGNRIHTGLQSSIQCRLDGGYVLTDPPVLFSSRGRTVDPEKCWTSGVRSRTKWGSAYEQGGSVVRSEDIDTKTDPVRELGKGEEGDRSRISKTSRVRL